MQSQWANDSMVANGSRTQYGGQLASLTGTGPRTVSLPAIPSSVHKVTLALICTGPTAPFRVSTGDTFLFASNGCDDAAQIASMRPAQLRSGSLRITLNPHARWNLLVLGN